MVPQNFYY